MVRWTTCSRNLTSWRAKNRSEQTRIAIGSSAGARSIQTVESRSSSTPALASYRRSVLLGLSLDYFCCTLSSFRSIGLRSLMPNRPIAWRILIL